MTLFRHLLRISGILAFGLLLSISFVSCGQDEPEQDNEEWEWNYDDDDDYDDEEDDNNYGGNGSNGGSSSHHFPCKSCDETGKCWDCFGKGINPATKKKCNLCHGSGKCPMCHGKGYTIL